MSDMMYGDSAPIEQSDYVIDTIIIGLLAMTQALAPALVWFLVIKNRPGMASFDSATNDWYYISWWTMWIGNLIAYATPALLWIPAYFSSSVSMIYMMSWIFGIMIAMVTGLFAWTSLLISVIEWKDNKDIWTTLVLYTIVELVMLAMTM